MKQIFPACFILILLMVSGLIWSSKAYAQQPSNTSLDKVRFQQPAQTKGEGLSDQTPGKVASLTTQKLASATCLQCGGDMLDIDAVKLLIAEVEAKALNPDFDWEQALKHLYSSPHVMKVPIMDPTFPVMLLSGDKKADMQAYNRAKSEWIRRYPERYEALKKSRK